jgi:hypothetical protein
MRISKNHHLHRGADASCRVSRQLQPIKTSKNEESFAIIETLRLRGQQHALFFVVAMPHPPTIVNCLKVPFDGSHDGI